MRLLWRSQKGASTEVPWGEANGEMRKGRRVRYITLPFKYGDGDGLALAPRALFAHMPFTPTAAITHLTAARGFNAKVRVGDPRQRGQASSARPPSAPRSHALPVRAPALLPAAHSR